MQGFFAHIRKRSVVFYHNFREYYLPLLKAASLISLPYVGAILYNYFIDPKIHLVTRHGDVYELTDTTRQCDKVGKIRYTVESGDSLYKPTREDRCIRCGKLYREHEIYKTEKQKAMDSMPIYGPD